MNKLFRPKCLRRVLLCLALLFPIVYLCGGLFFALAGSHGNYDWHENTLVNRDYDEAMETENFKYSDWDWKNEDYGTRLGFSHGYYLPSSDDEMYFYFNSLGVQADGNGTNRGLGFSGDFIAPYYFGICIVTEDDFTVNQLYTDETYEYDCFSIFYSVNQDGFASIFLIEIAEGAMDDLFIYTYYPSDNAWFSESIGGVLLYPYMYFDDGAHLPVGAFDLLPSNLKNALRPTLKPIESDSLSDYIFSQPFAKDNFISTLGRNLIDGSTKGFNPMNELFRTINTNIMHFENTDGLAMFGLGYVYYAVNVLIIYEVLILAVKLILLPLKAVDLFDKDKEI